MAGSVGDAKIASSASFLRVRSMHVNLRGGILAAILFQLVVAGSAGADCKLPPKAPQMPQGATASDDEMKEGHSALQKYVNDLEVYQTCVDNQIKNAPPDTKPEVKQFYCSGKEAYFYAPAERQATRFSVKESTDVRIPLRFLLGKLNLRRIFAKVELATDLAPIDPGDPVLKLWPKNGETFLDVYLEIDAQSRIRRLVIDDGDGSRSDFRLSAEEANPHLDSNLFRFTAPPGVTIVDERSGQ